MEMKEHQKLISSNEVGKKMDEFEDLFQALEQKLDWDGCLLGRYHGFWLDSDLLQALLSFQTHFLAKDTDIIIASMPKSGTTWLKALTFSIVNRHRYAAAESPLLSSNPHELVPFFETHMYNKDDKPNIESIPDPRVFSTHIPHQLLPDTILTSECKIVYICRNPLDNFISDWHFSLQNQFGPRQQPLPIDESLELFCEGINIYSPFWDNMLGYRYASLKNPQKVLFLKYEELKKDIISSVKKIADFVGFSFSAEEERGGIIEEITRLCGFENLKNLEVNKKGEWQATSFKVKHSSFFRKGEVGDWANHLSPSVAERLQKLMEEKFGEAGLSFEINT